METAMIFPVVTFGVFFGGIWAAYWLFVLRPEQQAVGVVRKRLKAARQMKAVHSSLQKQMEALSSVRGLDVALRRFESRTKGLQMLIEQSGVRMSLVSLLACSGTLALLAAIVVHRLTADVSALGSGRLLLALAAAIVAVFIPIQALKYARTLRMRKFEEQLPEALDLLARSLRAGHAFTAGMEMVATEMPKPVGPEFRLLYDQQNYGMPIGDALRRFAERIPILDARFFVTAVLIQRESGGNLSEVLDNLSKVIRERFRVKRQMRVISAHGRITGWILVCLPPGLALALMTISDEHRRTMFGEPLGIQMMIGAGVLQVIGTLIIRKIVDVEY
jgi:tight adherence protein B